MPYFAHVKGSEPTFGRMFDTKADAHSFASPHKWDVTLLLSEQEREAWRSREQDRFYVGEYQKTPWSEHYISAEMREKVKDHFCHMSIKTPGKVAYTPSDEHGYQDRQVAVKPGKYLTEFYADVFSKEEIDEFVTIVKGAYDGFKVATTADDVEAVYKNGPNSCMSHSDGSYSSHCHPTRVYGDSDLAVAYLGDIATRVSARCVIWPDQKRYSCVYGDSTLNRILEREGYAEGSMIGARIQAIREGSRHSDVFVMPYIDDAGGCELVKDADGKQWFKLSRHEHGYSVKNTDGLSSSLHPCENCGEGCDEDDRYCESCRESLYSCERCGEETFDSDDFREVESRYGSEWYCESCASRHEHTCEACEDTWYSKVNEGAFCKDCEDDWTHCQACEDATPCDEVKEQSDGSGDMVCKDCYVEEEDEDTEIEAEDDTETLDLPLSAEPSTPVAEPTSEPSTPEPATPVQATCCRVASNHGAIHCPICLDDVDRHANRVTLGLCSTPDRQAELVRRMVDEDTPFTPVQEVA